jgi:hypothetical protein
MKLEPLTNSTLIDDAIRFVCNRSNEKLRLSSNSDEDHKESKEPDYDQDKDQLEEEQEEETGQMTINRVF